MKEFAVAHPFWFCVVAVILASMFLEGVVKVFSTILISFHNDRVLQRMYEQGTISMDEYRRKRGFPSNPS